MLSLHRQLPASGWFVCERTGMDFVNHSGVAVREVHLVEAGRADHLKYVEKRLREVIEAQSALTKWARRYAHEFTEPALAVRFVAMKVSHGVGDE